MNSTATLTGPLLRTYTTIFQHPVSHNLEWRHVHTLFRHLGQVEEVANGNLKVTRNGETLVLHPPRTKDVAETEELMALRHFLERSETARPAGEDQEEKTTHWLLVIGHHEARLFHAELDGAVPQTLRPHAADEFFRQAPNAQDFSRGKERPDPNSYFEPVAKALQAAGPIVIFGSGTGKGSEMDQFIAWIKLHRSDLAKRVIGTRVVDGSHLTDGQLLEQAREFYAKHLGPQD